jgi:hypothetical protein
MRGDIRHPPAEALKRGLAALLYAVLSPNRDPDGFGVSVLIGTRISTGSARAD